MRLVRLVPALLLALLLAPAARADVPEGATWTEAYFPSGDGTLLHADVMRPADLPADAKTPVILSVGPYFGHAGQQGALDFDPTAEGPSDRFDDMLEAGRPFERGYTVVYVDARGFGGSAGCNDFGGPGERADAKAAVEWAAEQPWSTGRVGTWGKSYDGWTQVMALDGKPKGLAAAVIQSPIIDGYRTFFHNGVHYDVGWYNTPALYQQIDLAPPTVFDRPAYFLGFLTGTNPLCYATNIVEQDTTLDEDAAFWQARALPGARGSDVPVLWSHGFVDANTKPDNFLPVWSTLEGPKRAWFGQYAHDRPNDPVPDDSPVRGAKTKSGREGFIEEAMTWFDRYVKGEPAARARVEASAPVAVQDNRGRWRLEEAWPPTDAATSGMPLRGGSVTDAPFNDDDAFWSISQPLPHDAHIAGAPRLVAEIGAAAARANLFAQLYDIAPNGGTKLVTRGAKLVEGGGVVDFDLYPEDWFVAAGHRLGLRFSGSDSDWYLPVPSLQAISVRTGALAIPFLRHRRVRAIDGVQSYALATRSESVAVDAATIGASAVTLELPAPLTALPSPVRVSLRRAGRGQVRAAGRAPAGTVVTVRLRRGSRTVATRRVVARANRRYSVTFRRLRRGRYGATATIRRDGQSDRGSARALRLR